MLIEPADKRYLEAAKGYYDLGMYSEADASLSKISEIGQSTSAVLRVRADIYDLVEDWESLQPVVRHLAKLEPEDVRWLILDASVTRRLGSSKAAKDILLQALPSYPNDPALQYELSRYEAQAGNIDQAKKYLKRAVSIDPRFGLMAVNEPDLEALCAPGTLQSEIGD